MPLTEEQTLIQETARGFARQRLAPNAARWDRDGTFPADAVGETGALGLLGMLVPEEWNGAGADHVSYVLAMAEIAAGDGGCSTVVSVQNLVCCCVLGFGTPEQKQRFLKPMARGEMLGAFALTEPHAGSDAANIKCRAKRRGNHRGNYAPGLASAQPGKRNH